MVIGMSCYGYGDGYGYGYGIAGAALVGERGNRFDAEEEIDEDQGRDQALPEQRA